ncbi:DUF4145 domain-containing protein [Clostridium perfringens]|nr:DUF4145 domain-containing protein [Clostridium perfringens]
MDKEGYDREGYNERGFDRDGFDKQGYNLKGEYLGFIDKYLLDNTNIKIKNKKLIYSEEIKDIFIDIERCKKTISIEDYVAALSHLRRASERMLTEIILQSDTQNKSLKDLTSFQKINIIKGNNIITAKEVKLLDEIRLTGNEAVHEAIGDKKTNFNVFRKIQKFLSWMVRN